MFFRYHEHIRPISFLNLSHDPIQGNISVLAFLDSFNGNPDSGMLSGIFVRTFFYHLIRM